MQFDGVFKVYDERFTSIGEARRDEYSQFGEDGLIEAVFARIGIRNRWCFEVGAADGVYLSNTKRLWDDEWNAVLIESRDEEFAKLSQHQSSRVRCVHKLIGDEDLERILAEAGAPHDMDLGVIDIDGRDYYAWQKMKAHRPRLMMVECLSGKNYADSPTPPDIQASAEELNELARVKDYTPICRTHCNVLYVANEVEL